MGDGGATAGLGPQAPDKAGIVGVVVAQQLDRHWAVQDLIDRLPDLAHAAGGQPPAQPVAAGQLAVGVSQDHAANYPADGHLNHLRSGSLAGSGSAAWAVIRLSCWWSCAGCAP